ncbi:MAG: hypothetical protein DMF74_28810 [Acidobacteria bacterium]|nr:MAG: hypothetical protein DMF74_28810 [Acidobacteriota bacterium]
MPFNSLTHRGGEKRKDLTMKLRSLIRTACFAMIVCWISLYIYLRFAFSKSSDTGIMIETALLIPVVAAAALLAILNLRHFSFRLKRKSPGLAHTVSWFFFLASLVVLLLNLSHIWFITPMRVISFFLVALVLSLCLNAGTYLRFNKQLDR